MRLSIFFLFILALSACGSGTPITFHNQSEHQLEAVELSGSGFKASLGVIATHQSLTTKVIPSGESGLAVSFMVMGRSYSYKPQDYFEGGGMYKVSAKVNRDLTVSVHSETGPY